jgi:hypothetical protein
MRKVLTIVSPLFGVLVLLGLGPNPKPARPLTPGQTYCTGTTPCVTTYHNDNNRDAMNPNEGAFKASTLGPSNHPSPRWLATTDGQIYAQPLYLHQLMMNGAPKNVVYVATENNSVYAFDSDSTSNTGTTLVSTSLNNASDLGTGYTEIALPSADLPHGCGNITPEVGITGTPVIDLSVTPPVIYLVTKHQDIDSNGGESYRQKLHGLYADTLQEIPGSPVVLDKTFSATYTGNIFNPVSNNQRAGLALVTGADGSAKIWVSWGSHCDDTPYHGYAIEFTYNYQNSAFNTSYTLFDSEASCSAGRCMSGIWMSGAAPAADAQGNVYLATGNGADTFQGAGEYSNSLLKLNDSGLQDFYSPPDFDAMNHGKTVVACSNPHPTKCAAPCQLDTTGTYCQVNLVPEDWDMGTSGVVLLAPTFPLRYPELTTSGKQGMIYVMFAGNLGQIDSQSANPDKYACTTAGQPTSGAIVQCFMGFAMHDKSTNPNTGGRGAPAFLAGQTGKNARNYLYVSGVGDILKAYHVINTGGIATLSTWASTPVTPHKFLYPGAVLAITWQKTKGNVDDAIVWALDSSGFGTPVKPATAAVMYSYKAVPSKQGGGTLGASLWDTSAYNNSFPGNPGAVKFMSPTIVDGKVFMGGGAQGYQPGSSNCPSPSTAIQPTTCGGLAMYK